MEIVTDDAVEGGSSGVRRSADVRSSASAARIIAVVAIVLCAITVLRIVVAEPALQGELVLAPMVDGGPTVDGAGAPGFDMRNLEQRLDAVDQIELDEVLTDVDSMLAMHTASQLDYDICRNDFGQITDKPAATASRMFAC